MSFCSPPPWLQQRSSHGAGDEGKKPGIKIAFVGPQVQIKPAESLLASPDIDFVVRGEFDHAVVEYAQGKPLSEIANASYLKDGKVVHNPRAAA